MSPRALNPLLEKTKELGLPPIKPNLNWKEALDYVGNLLPSQLAKLCVDEAREKLLQLPEIPVKVLVSAAVYGMMISNPKTAAGVLEKIQNRQDGAVPIERKERRELSIRIGLPDDGWRPDGEGIKLGGELDAKTLRGKARKLLQGLTAQELEIKDAIVRMNGEP